MTSSCGYVWLLVTWVTVARLERETIPELVLTVGPNTDLNVDSGAGGPANLRSLLVFSFF